MPEVPAYWVKSRPPFPAYPSLFSPEAPAHGPHASDATAHRDLAQIFSMFHAIAVDAMA